MQLSWPEVRFLMVRAQSIVRNVRRLFHMLDAKQSLAFDYASAARQSGKNGNQHPLLSIGAAAKIVN
jgi:hypothetical protein